jgi:putative ATP-binding cassette transporter
VGHFRTLLAGFRELKQHRPRREAFERTALEAGSARARDASVAGLTWFALASTWGQVAYLGFIGLVVFALPRLVEVDRATLQASVLVVLYLMVPIDGLISWGGTLARARTSLERIERLGIELEMGDVERDAASALRWNDAIRLEGVTYGYGEDGFALGPVDLEVRPGDLLVIAGGNGSGKTTLIKLIAGLYAPGSGGITLDGGRVDNENRASYRQLFTVVFADGHLFERLDGLEPLELEDRAEELLVRLGLEGRVAVVDRAFSTLDLSQGQRRRLALLVACLESRPIVVLDEWAANQDPEFKRRFYLEILPELRARGQTVIVISHDDDYHFVADRVLRLREGRLVEEVCPVGPAVGT